MEALADAAAGVLGSLISLWTFYPIEVLKTTIQAGKNDQRCDTTLPFSSPSSTWSALSLYRGCSLKSAHTASSNFMYFFISSWIISKWKRHCRIRGNIPASTRLLLTAVAAMLNVVLTLPLDVLSAKSVTDQDDKNKQGNQNPFGFSKANGTMDASVETSLQNENDDDDEQMTQVWAALQDSGSDDEKEEFKKNGKVVGQVYQLPSPSAVSPVLIQKEKSTSKRFQLRDFPNLWKGLLPALLLCTNPAINYTVFDVVKSYALAKKNRSTKLSIAESFFLGLFAKSVATIATYPLIRAKVMLMVTSQKSMVACLKNAFQKDGMKGLYKGCDWQLLHTALKSALMMMIREQVSASARQLLVGGQASKVRPKSSN